MRVYPGRIEVALYDGTHASAPLEQAARKARGPKSGGGKAAGAVHTDHGEVHAPQGGREPSPGTTKAAATTVKCAQRVKWLPLLDAARTICFAPTPEMRLQMQIMRANPLRLARA